jgi:phosphatidylinositol-4,5-bisphosphate 4-phosphatase
MSGAKTAPQQPNPEPAREGAGNGAQPARRMSIGSARRNSQEIAPEPPLAPPAPPAALGGGAVARNPAPEIVADDPGLQGRDAFFQQLGIGPVGLDKFRDAKGSRIVLDPPAGVQSTGLPLKYKVTWTKANYKGWSSAETQQNKDAKTAFEKVLTKATGSNVASSALQAAELGPNWNKNSQPLEKKQVTKVLDESQQIRSKILDKTNDNFLTFLRGSDLRTRGIIKRKTEVDPDASPCLMKSFRQAKDQKADERPDLAYPQADLADPQLIKQFRREVREHPEYGKRTLGPNDLDTIAKGAINKFYDQKKAAFREQHPGLANFADRLEGNAPRQDNRTFVEAFQGKMDTQLAQDPDEFRTLAEDTLSALKESSALAGKTAYDPKSIKDLHRQISDQRVKLQALEGRFASDDNQPRSENGLSLRNDLINDLRHNQQSLGAKDSFLTDIEEHNPGSEKAIEYSNLLWAQGAGHIFEKAAQNPRADAGKLRSAKSEHINKRQWFHEHASATNPPADVDPKKTHPVVAGKADTVAFLKQELEAAGIPKSEIKKLTSNESLANARREALNRNQEWAPIVRDMVVTKDDVTRTYQSKITPAASISPRFERLYRDNPALQPQPIGPGQTRARPRSVSALEKADLTHPRNMKVSELQGPGPDGTKVTLAKVIGHGVLDMWGISDPEARKVANESAAHEVLEAAIATNDRVRQAAIAREREGQPPVKVTHVSLNLTTPSPTRERPGPRSMFPNHQEKTYTEEQFRAFEASSKGKDGGPASFKVDNPAGPDQPDVDINVEVDPITFSFGINPMATGVLQKPLGGWGEVYEHNKAALTKLIGDLGSSESNIGPRKVGAVGTTPGGFIGSVYDRLKLDEEEPQDENAKAEWRKRQAMGAKLRHQTNVTRAMFTNEDFRQGNGDPAKMGREILALQAYAEQALALTGSDDLGATMSRGCKSDKDRGGVTDVELKHKLITEDFGDLVLPDVKLSPEDQANYYAVAVASGQFENQQLNTGVPGSKEAGKLDKRIPDKWIREYLKGLGKFAEE